MKNWPAIGKRHSCRPGRGVKKMPLRLMRSVIPCLKRMSELAGLQKDQLEIFAGQLKNLTASNEGRMDKLRETR